MTTATIHPFPTKRMLDEEHDQCRVLDTAINASPVALTAVNIICQPGAYALLYGGDVECLSRARRPEGRHATGSIAVGGGFPVYVGSAKRLAERLRRHVRNLVAVVDLDVEDFVAVLLPTRTFAGGRYAEELLIDGFGVPVLNGAVKGFGSRHQGRQRVSQRISEFNVLFPGRKACTGPATVTAAILRERVVAHLAATVPDVFTSKCALPAQFVQPALKVRILRPS